MIEVVYAAKEKEEVNDIVRLPKNIKQVGDIKSERKVYIEDYAINYIEETETAFMEPGVGVLVGKNQKSGSDRYTFIKGAISIEDIFVSESEICFTENNWSVIYETVEKYFPSLEIVGWYISINGLNAAMLRTIKKVHLDQFGGTGKCIFIKDSQEMNRNFFVYENNQLVKLGGYTIYYERNEEMQEYMVDKRNRKMPEEYIAMAEMKKREEKVNKSAFDKQAFVNYCANVAILVLILFIGIYILDKNNTQSTESSYLPEVTSSTLTQVVKVEGEVYPTTEAETVQTEPTTENVSLYQVVNTKPMVESTEAEMVSEQQTQVATEAAAQVKTHEIKKGDNLTKISITYYGTDKMVDEIMALNDIEDIDKIYIGQIIKLP